MPDTITSAVADSIIDTTGLAISYADVAGAAERIAGVAHRTPVLTSRTADTLTGGELLFKCENFQRTGAFKIRGAYNAVSRFTPVQRALGVVAYSSGNHAQALALAASMLKVKSTIVMPQDARRPSWRRRAAMAPMWCCTTAMPSRRTPPSPACWRSGAAC